MTINKLEAEINKEFPKVWVRREDRHLVTGEGSEIDGMEVFNYYSEDYTETTYIMGVYKPFYKFLEERGFYCECQDPGTYNIYKI